MARNKGICTLCGKGTRLTFEHVPAEGSGNQRGVIMHSLDEWLARDHTSGQLPGGVPQPEGMGLSALCRKCNSDLGTHYVPAFIDFVEAGKQMLSSVVTMLGDIDGRDRGTHVTGVFLAINRLAVAKQIVSMLLVTSGRGVVKANPALEHFVRTPAAQGLPPEYRLFLALTPGPAAKTTGLSAWTDLPTGKMWVASEVVYPPFAYALSFNGTDVYDAGEITHWASAGHSVIAEESLVLPLGFCHTAFPGDLRTRVQIEIERKKNEGGK